MRDRLTCAGVAIALLASAPPLNALEVVARAEAGKRELAPVIGASSDMPLRITLERRKVSIKDGNELLLQADSAGPGDLLEDVATYTNVSKYPLQVSDATLPVPENTELQISTVRPAKFWVSLDGKKYERAPIRVKLQRGNGTVLEQEVAVESYRYLRWAPGEIFPGESVAFSARFRVSGELQPNRQKPD
jgi:hypothetical protein